MLLFLDANAIFAAAISPKGRAHALFDLAGAGYGTLLTSGFAAEEASRNVERKYPDAEVRAEVLLGQCRTVPEGKPAWAHDLLPAKDAPILAAAVEAGAELLVTGDRAHLCALWANVRGDRGRAACRRTRAAVGALTPRCSLVCCVRNRARQGWQ